MTQLTVNERQTRKRIAIGTSIFGAGVLAPFALGMTEAFYQKNGGSLDTTTDDLLRCGTIALDSILGACFLGAYMSGPNGPSADKKDNYLVTGSGVIVGG
ncbi:MAG: hypothetical protein WCK90_04900, partial [archaeon]